MHVYHFGLQGELVWLFHIFLGAYLLYLGYRLLNKQGVTQFEALTLIVLGVLGALYHAHIWYYVSQQHTENK